MLKLSPRRNQRSSSRGVKVKHALHICVLGGVCIWLLYQVYHWRNKTATYEEASKKAEAGNRNDFIKLGRKDLDPRIEEMTAEDLKNGGQDAEEGKSFDDDDSNKAAELISQSLMLRKQRMDLPVQGMNPMLLVVKPVWRIIPILLRMLILVEMAKKLFQENRLIAQMQILFLPQQMENQVQILHLVNKVQFQLLKQR